MCECTQVLSAPRVSCHEDPFPKPTQGCTPEGHPPSQACCGLRPREERWQHEWAGVLSRELE